jgi:alpha-maltose-1-phosphate synthase
MVGSGIKVSVQPGSRVLLAHPGTQYAAKLAHQLWRRGVLHRFWGGLVISEPSLKKFQRYFPIMGPWTHNRCVDIPSSHLRTLPSLEFLYLLKRRLRGDSQRVVYQRNSCFQRRIPDEEIRAVNVGIGFDTSSSILIDRFHGFQKPFILDQTIAHSAAKARAFDSVRREFPSWKHDLEERLQEVAIAEAREHEKADRIVVASTFSRNTLLEYGIPSEKIAVNPYGVDLHRFHAAPTRGKDQPFRFLFAGLISARKGVPALLQAWRHMRPTNAELLLVGPTSKGIPNNWLAATPEVKFLGKLSNVALGQVMANADVFVFPSYFEGFGLVLLEAMASAMPVITTSSTAGRDIIEDGKSGWVIEPGDVEALVERMQFCVQNRSSLAAVGRRARTIAEGFSWNAYGARWLTLLEDELAQC